jgi:hypothetical protein
MVQFEFELIGIDEQIYDNFKTFTLELNPGSAVEIGAIGKAFLNAKNIYSAIMYDGKIYYSIENAEELNIRLQNLLKVSGQDYRAITDDKIERLREIKDDMEKMMKEMESAEAKFEKMKSKKNKIVRFQFWAWITVWALSILSYFIWNIQPTNLIIFTLLIAIMLKQLDRELIK